MFVRPEPCQRLTEAGGLISERANHVRRSGSTTNLFLSWVTERANCRSVNARSKTLVAIHVPRWDRKFITDYLRVITRPRRNSEVIISGISAAVIAATITHIRYLPDRRQSVRGKISCPLDSSTGLGFRIKRSSPHVLLRGSSNAEDKKKISRN